MSSSDVRGIVQALNSLSIKQWQIARLNAAAQIAAPLIAARGYVAAEDAVGVLTEIMEQMPQQFLPKKE